MIFESLAIIAIVIAMAFIFMRAKKKEYFWGMLPLLILPIMQLLSKPAILVISSFSAVRPITVNICMIFMALIVASILIGLAAANLKTKKQKTSYLLMCGGFSLVLAMIFILNAMKTALVLTSMAMFF